MKFFEFERGQHHFAARDRTSHTVRSKPDIVPAGRSNSGGVREVKRFNLEGHCCHGGSISSFITEQPNGGFIKYADHVALLHACEAHNAMLLARLRLAEAGSPHRGAFPDETNRRPSTQSSE